MQHTQQQIEKRYQLIRMIDKAIRLYGQFYSRALLIQDQTKFRQYLRMLDMMMDSAWYEYRNGHPEAIYALVAHGFFIVETKIEDAIAFEALQNRPQVKLRLVK